MLSAVATRCTAFFQHRVADGHDRAGGSADLFVMQFGTPALAMLVRTVAIVSPLYFFVNTAMVAAAIALSTVSRWSASGSATSVRGADGRRRRADVPRQGRPPLAQSGPGAGEAQ